MTCKENMVRIAIKTLSIILSIKFIICYKLSKKFRKEVDEIIEKYHNEQN